MKAFEEWIKQRREETGPLFLSERGHTRLIRQGIHHLVDQLGLNDYSAHSLRLVSPEPDWSHTMQYDSSITIIQIVGEEKKMTGWT
mgnify:CR=1 FL=1